MVYNSKFLEEITEQEGEFSPILANIERAMANFVWYDRQRTDLTRENEAQELLFERYQLKDYDHVNFPRRTYSLRTIRRGNDAYGWLKEFYKLNPTLKKPEGGISKLSAQEKVQLVRKISQKK